MYVFYNMSLKWISIVPYILFFLSISENNVVLTLNQVTKENREENKPQQINCQKKHLENDCILFPLNQTYLA